MMHLVGLTGGIASGKTTVANILRGSGVPIIDADLLARQVVEPGKPAYRKIVRVFGTEILQDAKPDAPIDRERLGAVIFKDSVSRKRLNQITHPAVMWAMGMQLLKYFFRGEPVVVLDVPLLYETGINNLMSKVVLVYVDRETQLQRLSLRDKRSELSAQSRIDSQMSLEEKREKADYVIDNRGGREETVQQVDGVCKTLAIGPYEPCGRSMKSERLARAAKRILLLAVAVVAIVGFLAYATARAVDTLKNTT